MVGLVLNHAGRKIMEPKLEGRAPAIHSPNGDLARPRHPSADVGNAETAFPPVDQVAADRE